MEKKHKIILIVVAVLVVIYFVRSNKLKKDGKPNGFKDVLGFGRKQTTPEAPKK